MFKLVDTLANCVRGEVLARGRAFGGPLILRNAIAATSATESGMKPAPLTGH